MGIWDSITSQVEDAADSVSDWWSATEDSEAAPSTYQQQAAQERMAEGSAIPRVHTATNATGETIVMSSSSYQPYLIGGAVLVVVLLVVVLLIKGGK